MVDRRASDGILSFILLQAFAELRFLLVLNTLSLSLDLIPAEVDMCSREALRCFVHMASYLLLRKRRWMS